MSRTWEDAQREDARLVVLRELQRQNDGRLNETLLLKVLDSFGHRRTRDWLRTQLRAMADLGAVALTEQGTVMIAQITRTGMDHVERRSVIEGIARPSPEL
jgi:hypothetical protein